MKTLIVAAIRCSLMFTAVAALSLAYPASVQADPTTYQYTGNPFTTIIGSRYTTSDFVTAMVTLAGPLRANMPLTGVTPLAFTLFDGVQTISNTTPDLFPFFVFATNARGEITAWSVGANARDPIFRAISTSHDFFIGGISTEDFGGGDAPGQGEAFNGDMPGVWSQGFATPDAGSTLSLMTLTFMALGLVARRFQRAAG